MKKILFFLPASLLVVAFSFNPGYSEDASGELSLLDKVRKTESVMNNRKPPKKAEDPLIEKYLAVGEECSEKYETCLDKCAEAEKEEENEKCDTKCREELALCEKALPDYLKTIK
jgi:hypothetical protein